MLRPLDLADRFPSQVRRKRPSAPLDGCGLRPGEDADAVVARAPRPGARPPPCRPAGGGGRPLWTTETREPMPARRAAPARTRPRRRPRRRALSGTSLTLVASRLVQCAQLVEPRRSAARPGASRSRPSGRRTEAPARRRARGRPPPRRPCPARPSRPCPRSTPTWLVSSFSEISSRHPNTRLDVDRGRTASPRPGGGARRDARPRTAEAASSTGCTPSTSTRRRRAPAPRA